VSNRCQNKTSLNPAHSVPYSLALTKQWQENSVIIQIIKFLSDRTTSGKCHASVTSLFSEIKGFFFSFNKRSPKDTLGNWGWDCKWKFMIVLFNQHDNHSNTNCAKIHLICCFSWTIFFCVKKVKFNLRWLATVLSTFWDWDGSL